MMKKIYEVIVEITKTNGILSQEDADHILKYHMDSVRKMGAGWGDTHVWLKVVDVVEQQEKQ